MKVTAVPHITLSEGNSVNGGMKVCHTRDGMEYSMRMTDETFNGSDLKGMVLGMRNGHMDLRYDMGNKSAMVRMDANCRMADRDVRMRLRHNTCNKAATTMEAMVDVNDNNKAIVVYDMSNWDGLDAKKMSLKWRYTKDDMSVEPGYNFGTESVFVDARYKMDDENRLRCLYDNHNRNAHLEWINSSGMGGGGDMKVCASMCLDDGANKMPTLRVEKCWDMDW